jgi:hypothetical protein
MVKYKGQSAMEYLMTYGWALLVIVIVIAILMFINPFQLETCMFTTPGFHCEGHRLVVDGDNVALYATITNANQKAIDVVAIAFVQGSNDPQGSSGNWYDAGETFYDIRDGSGGSLLGRLSHGADFNTGGSTMENDVLPAIDQGGAGGLLLLDPDGDFVDGLGSGSDVSGRLYIAFNYQDDPKESGDYAVPPKVAVANIRGRVQ